MTLSRRNSGIIVSNFVSFFIATNFCPIFLPSENLPVWTGILKRSLCLTKAPTNALLSAVQVLDGHRRFLMYQVIITKFVNSYMNINAPVEIRCWQPVCIYTVVFIIVL
jgi:hypothetical protein